MTAKVLIQVVDPHEIILQVTDAYGDLVTDRTHDDIMEAVEEARISADILGVTVKIV